MVKKILIGLVCILLAGFLVFGIQKFQQEEAERSAALRELTQEMDTLRSRQVELQAEIEAAREKLVAELRGMGTFTLLVTDLNADFMERLVPVLQEAGVPAVMVLTQEGFPGNEGMIRLSDFLQRLEDGWDYCVACDGTVEFEEWYSGMSELLEANDLTMPGALYCSGRSYTAEVGKAAQNRGFGTIVHSGEEGLPIVDSEFGDPWCVGSVRWIMSGARSYMEQAAATGGSMAFTVDQNDFSESEFSAMLRLVKQYQEEESLLASTLVGAGTYRAEDASQIEAAQNDPEYDATIAALQEELDSVNEQIQVLTESR